MLKKEIKVIKKKGLHHIINDKGSLLKFKPWLGDAFSFLYDFVMKSSIPSENGALLYFRAFTK